MEYPLNIRTNIIHNFTAELQFDKTHVSTYVPCEALSGNEITCLSEHEHDNTLLVACRSGLVRGISVADVASASSQVLFSLPASQQPAIQVSPAPLPSLSQTTPFHTPTCATFSLRFPSHPLSHLPFLDFLHSPFL
jgi:hypothetical protein